ncbi:ADP-ribosylglycohydrolase family protein [Acidobacteriota bacterium]
MSNNQFKGCLLGLAIGDAFGAPVEFLQLHGIKAKYGEAGIQDLDGWRGFPAGAYTDDTQMALATARGCVRAWEAQVTANSDRVDALVYEEYLNWLKTQYDPHERRAPGNTCLGALRSGRMGTIEDAINNSKGCGGVMRTAPAGLAFKGKRAFEMGARFAAMTHSHPSGYLSAGFLAEMIAWIIDGRSLEDSIESGKKTLKGYSGHEETLRAVEQAVELAATADAPMDVIPRLGEGWVGEEALAISLYCALKLSDDYRGGIAAAVNHSGDSDSTGSITGAILGAKLGVEAIPEKWIARLENGSMISELAQSMNSCFGAKRS